MIAPVSSNFTSVPSDTASETVKTEAVTTQAPQPVQPEKITDTANNQSQTSQDTVALSSTALNMSKSLNEQDDKTSELKKASTRLQTQSTENEGKAYIAAGKAYPPFMGNSEELKNLKDSAPALYREILRMIVPPPLNISPMDLQMLQGSQSNSSSLKLEGTTT